jgi:tubulin-specific chaperone D
MRLLSIHRYGKCDIYDRYRTVILLNLPLVLQSTIVLPMSHGIEDEGNDRHDDRTGETTATTTTTMSIGSPLCIMFEDEQRANNCIQELCVNRDNEGGYSANDRALEELRCIFDKYLELPSLLDGCLASMVQELTNAARPLLRDLSRTINDKRTHGEEERSIDVEIFQKSPLSRILSTIYALSKVRGRKKIQKFLSHQVDDVELVLNALFTFDSIRHAETKSTMDSVNIDIPEYVEHVDGGPRLWESLYTLWNWMGIIGKIPFDCLVVLDDQQISDFFKLATMHLSETGPIREVAASCLAVWLTRPDMEHSHFQRSFRDWAKSKLNAYTCGNDHDSDLFKSEKTTIFTVLGILQTIVTMLKVSTADRPVILACAEPFWDEISTLSCSTKFTSNLLLRKCMIKWWTRIGMLYLPPRVASWRYQRGRRLLQNNVQCHHNDQNGKEEGRSNGDLLANSREDQSQDYFFIVPIQVEVAMDQVLRSLGDVSTVVRWSSAKGVGRITSRLPSICAEDVLDAIMSLFDNMERDNDWHGACLALAEMARRGLLLPHRLNEVVVKIVEAIHYDIPRRQTSIGAHVRDAACYTYWALARAYSPETLRPFVPQLGESIVVAFLFDREVNCRRAANAAFQEMVGRQGTQNFQNGISILTTADFFSLGSRRDAYTTIACHVAQFNEYCRPMIDHVFQRKIPHWDPIIRQLASQCLNCLTIRDPGYMAEIVLPCLIESTLDPDNAQSRHGALLGVAEIVLAFGDLGSVDSYLPGTLLQTIIEIIPNIERRRLYRGKGGELTRAAVCRLIERISIAGLALTVPQQVRMLDSIDACLPHPNEMVQCCAGEALFQLMRKYFPVSGQGPSSRLQNRVVGKYTELLQTSNNPAATRGFSLAVGCLPAKLLAPSSEVLDLSLSCLSILAHPTARVGPDKDAETRRNALKSLSRVCQTVLMYDAGDSKVSIVRVTVKQLSLVFNAFCRSMDDYNRDQRGDVGSMCRIAAMNGLIHLATLTSQQPHLDFEFLSHDRCLRVIGLLLKQFAEKLDFVRSEAARCLVGCLDRCSPIKRFLIKRDLLVEALTSPNHGVNVTYIAASWADASMTFPMAMKAAEIEEYFEYVISGVIVSVGCLTQSVAKHASAELLKWCRQASREDLDRLGHGKDISTRGLYVRVIVDMLTGNFVPVFLDLYEKHKGEGRVTLPLSKTIDLLMNRRCMEPLILNQSFALLLLSKLREDIRMCIDIPRLHATLNVSTGLIRSVKQSPEAIAFVCSLLMHQFPRIRSLAAEKLYVRVQETDPDLNDDHKAMTMLLHHSWEVQGRGDEKCKDAAREVSEAFHINNFVQIVEALPVHVECS